jgi:diketogulonate reductase-like aldo/keto reductase
VAIKECGVPRDKLFVTTKCSGTLVQDTEESFVESLKKLQLDYVDLYLIHAPFFAKSPADLQAKWAGFEKILASGRAKAIGVSNFLQSDLEVILETAKVIPSINQIEYHPYLQHGNLIPFSKSHNIATCAYGPLTAITRASGGPLGGIYEELAKKYNVTPAEIALRWVIDQDIVALTTSSKEERLKAYLKATEFKLTPEEVETISKVGADRHYRSFWQDKFDKDDRR